MNYRVCQLVSQVTDESDDGEKSCCVRSRRLMEEKLGVEDNVKG
jgi:hypothetical protein